MQGSSASSLSMLLLLRRTPSLAQSVLPGQSFRLPIDDLRIVQSGAASAFLTTASQDVKGSHSDGYKVGYAHRAVQPAQTAF